MSLRGIVWGLACIGVAGCSFDSSGVTYGAADDEPGATDAGSGPGGGRPDASPADPDGTVRSRRGTVDLFDHSFEDWGDAPTYTFSIASGADYHPISGYQPSATLTFASKHDDDTIYFALVVEDDAVLPAEQPLWNDDSVAIYLDAAGDRSGSFGADDHEVIIGSSGTYLDYAPGAANASVSGDVFATAGGYALEVGISKASLGVATVPDTIGFDIGINDDDTGGDAAFGLWFVRSAPSCPSCCDGFSHPEAWCDTTIFGSLVLE